MPTSIRTRLEVVMLAAVVAVGLSGSVRAQSADSSTGYQEPQREECPKGSRGGAIAGIVVASVFWWVLPMSIPVWVTQAKKLKKHNKARSERRCGY